MGTFDLREMLKLGGFLFLLVFLGQAKGECDQKICRKKVSTNGGLRENYDIKFKNFRSDRQVSELILMRDFVIKQNGQFITRPGTPLIMSIRNVNDNFILEPVQMNKGR